MTAAVPTPHSLEAATLVNTVLQSEGWLAPKGYANGVVSDGGTIDNGGLAGRDGDEKFPTGLMASRTRPSTIFATCWPVQAQARNISPG